jgi:hypothetical protein
MAGGLSRLIFLLASSLIGSNPVTGFFFIKFPFTDFL